MNFQISTYRTFSGIKEIVEIPRKKVTQWVIYQDNKPKFFVDFFDLEKESNSMMNSLVLCGKKSIEEVLELINKKNNIYLSIPKISKIGIQKKIKTESKELNLEALPEEWLAYSF
jgi:hypothetical protein